MKKSTLNDVARTTGLSVTTISRVINGKSEEYRISEATREKVLRAIRELNYKPNLIAQSLRSSSTHTIGLLVPRIENPFFANIASIIIQEANRYTYPVVVIDTRENPFDEDRAIDTLLARNIDGIIMAPCSDNARRINEVVRQTPVVLVDRYYEDADFGDVPYVSTDNYVGAMEATQLLISQGHTNILCIQGSPISVTSRNRVRGYCDSLREAGLADNINIRGNEYSIENGYIEAKLALMSGEPVTAILALSSTIMLGVLKAVKEHGLRVPEDISLVSFDNNIFIDYLDPPITRVAQPIEHIGIVAVKMLMDTILDKGVMNKSVLLPPRLIQGKSIASLRDDIRAKA